MHTHALPVTVKNGYVFHYSCDESRWFDVPLDANSSCVSSMLMVFRDDTRAVPYCMLDKYSFDARTCLSQPLFGISAKKCVQVSRLISITDDK